jgi:hypothetical protein
MVTRSSMPLPSRTTICCEAKSMSVAPHCRPAIHRTAVPSSQVTIHASEAGMDPLTFRASAVVSTVGTRVGCRAWMASMGRPSSYLTPSRERHSRALRAWFWVEAATFCWTTRWFRKTSMSALPISLGWRVSWKNRYWWRIHKTPILSLRSAPSPQRFRSVLDHSPPVCRGVLSPWTL